MGRFIAARVLCPYIRSLVELLFQIFYFFLEFANSIRLTFRFSEPYFTRKKMRVTDLLLAGLPLQANNERGLA